MESNTPYITNLVNSIIGVSVLAMPFCMKKCGLLLGLGLLIGMSWLTYVSCNMLITAAVVKRRRTYEYLAFYTVGPTGKFAVELSMIGLMLGTCTAFYVIIGDLATAILQEQVKADPAQLRTVVIVFCALCVALPLGLMKSLSVLGFIGFFSVIFYCLFVCVMIANSVSSGFLTFKWTGKIDLFRPEGVFQCLPIFSLAYACQCQLFVVYDSLEDASLMRMEKIVAYSLKIVTFVYCMVAILGYTTYADLVEGNVLKNFSPNIILDLIKFGFAISVVVGFPLMIFPCRQSIYTLFFSQHPVEGVASKTYIEPFMFKAITLCIVLSTMMVAIFIPNVETILGLTGATMGSFICFIFPGIIYNKAKPKEEISISKFVLAVGCVLLVLCTYSNIYSAASREKAIKKPAPADAAVDNLPNVKELPDVVKEMPVVPSKPPVAAVVGPEHRHEPANPVEPIVKDKHDNIPDENEVLNHMKPPGQVNPVQKEPPKEDDEKKLNEKLSLKGKNSPQHDSILNHAKDDLLDQKKNVDFQNENIALKGDNKVVRDGENRIESKKENLPDIDSKSKNPSENVGKEKENKKVDVKRNAAQESNAQAAKNENKIPISHDLPPKKNSEEIDADALIKQIKEHQEKQHALLHKEVALIHALEKQQKDQINKLKEIESHDNNAANQADFVAQTANKGVGDAPQIVEVNQENAEPIKAKGQLEMRENSPKKDNTLHSNLKENRQELDVNDNIASEKGLGQAKHLSEGKDSLKNSNLKHVEVDQKNNNPKDHLGSLRHEREIHENILPQSNEKVEVRGVFINS